MTVPAAPPRSSIATAAEAGNPLVPKPPSGGSRLGFKQQAQVPAQAGRNIPIRNLAPPPPKKKNVFVRIVVAAVVVIALGAGGYFGYQWWQERSESKNAQPVKTAGKTQAQPGAGGQAQTNAAPARPPKAPAVAAPTWTLDVNAAQIPEGRLGGSIGGASFVADTVRIGQLGSAQVLRLGQGPIASPDRDILIYLRLKAGEQLDGQTLTVAKDGKADRIQQIIKRWKASPQAQLQMKSFASGYALKLELGQMADGALPGKIYLALPDPEQTVVAGSFKALNSLTDAAPPKPPAASPAPAPAPTAATVKPEERVGVAAP